jgi:hypothetical protein
MYVRAEGGWDKEIVWEDESELVLGPVMNIYVV